ncbi:YtxH domain-containing protein [Emticicia sp. W12TSBA100-4]|uniref:YtxH domain-containing protein n=1 Tax=Emticicia sp. W12TSBA100-4 TaxID=3160965 RepID=UPI003305EA88
MTKNSKIIIGIAAAAAAGAAIGVLFAPEKGSKLRERVREAANDFATDLLDAIQRGGRQYTDSADNIEDAAKRLKSKAVGKVAELKDRFQDGVEDVKDVVNA